jgi:hypothetical protein
MLPKFRPIVNRAPGRLLHPQASTIACGRPSGFRLIPDSTAHRPTPENFIFRLRLERNLPSASKSDWASHDAHYECPTVSRCQHLFWCEALEIEMPIGALIGSLRPWVFLSEGEGTWMSMMGDIFNQSWYTISCAFEPFFLICALGCVEEALLFEAEVQRLDQIVRSKPLILKPVRIHSTQRMVSMALGKLFSSQYIGVSRRSLGLEALAMAGQLATQACG